MPSLASHVGADGARFAAIVDCCLRLDPAARYATGDDLREALERIAAPQLGGELPEGNPYRGLVAFEAEDRALFFGRGAEIRAVIERLRSDGFVLVTGDSGVGKSSLCRAGVLPNVAAGELHDGLDWQIVRLVPGQRPLTSLASALAAVPAIGDLLDETALLALMRDQPHALGRELRRGLGRARGLLVFVDQLEEVVTLADAAEAQIFARALAQLADGTPGLRLLATVRGDFVTRVAELRAFEGELARALYVLRPLSAEGARDAIVGPARAKGGRFESEELVDTLVASVAADSTGTREHVELPLLEFTLAQLWDAREPTTQTITAYTLDAIGGVRGALARHADRVVEALLPAQRAAARRVLLRLVTAERTRERRTAAELGADVDGAARDALDALVRGRLVVARGADTPEFELAHERLIDGWPALAEWLSKTAEVRAIRGRLAAAASDWKRLGHAKEALWRDRQLADLAQLAPDELTAGEKAFADASRRALRRRRVARIALAIAVPAVAASVYVGARLVADRDRARAIASKVQVAEQAIARAHTATEQTLARRTQAVAAFNAEQDAEAVWRDAREHEAEADRALATAASELEAALLLDTARADVRRKLAEVTYQRIQLADDVFKDVGRGELLSRLALYDRGGELMRKLTAPATIDIALHPAGAAVTISRADGEDVRSVARTTTELPPGSYVLVAQAPVRAAVRLPFVATCNETSKLAFELPEASDVPAGYIYVPPGDFLYGSRDDEAVRRFYGASPMHKRATAAYLIGRTEITYAQWIEFLDALPEAERARRTPHVEASETVQAAGGVELHRDASGWTLHFAPAGREYAAHAGQRIVYPGRTQHREQDWLRMPVSGITPDDVQAYAAWLDATRRVPHARLCTEPEWERAARGADGRTYPHGGETLAPDDANIDITYGRAADGFGPDEVGAHPASTSPFGLADVSGNVWEIVRTPTNKLVLRGGSFYTNTYSAALANRGEVITPTFRHVLVGARICADVSRP